MPDFDISRVYGSTWYLIAHYSFDFLMDRHCMEVVFNSDDAGGCDEKGGGGCSSADHHDEAELNCRVPMSYTTVDIDDMEIKTERYYRMLANVSQPAVWIDTVRK